MWYNCDVVLDDKKFQEKFCAVSSEGWVLNLDIVWTLCRMESAVDTFMWNKKVNGRVILPSGLIISIQSLSINIGYDRSLVSEIWGMNSGFSFTGFFGYNF